MTDPNPSSFLPLSPVTYHILLALANGKRHGYAILGDVESITDGAITLETGTLYAAIRRLRKDGLLDTAQATDGEDSRRKNYELSALGRAVLERETARLRQVLEAAKARDVLPATG